MRTLGRGTALVLLVALSGTGLHAQAPTAADDEPERGWTLEADGRPASLTRWARRLGACPGWRVDYFGPPRAVRLPAGRAGLWRALVGLCADGRLSYALGPGRRIALLPGVTPLVGLARAGPLRVTALAPDPVARRLPLWVEPAAWRIVDGVPLVPRLEGGSGWRLRGATGSVVLTEAGGARRGLRTVVRLAWDGDLPAGPLALVGTLRVRTAGRVERVTLGDASRPVSLPGTPARLTVSPPVWIRRSWRVPLVVEGLGGDRLPVHDVHVVDAEGVRRSPLLVPPTLSDGRTVLLFDEPAAPRRLTLAYVVERRAEVVPLALGGLRPVARSRASIRGRIEVAQAATGPERLEVGCRPLGGGPAVVRVGHLGPGPAREVAGRDGALALGPSGGRYQLAGLAPGVHHVWVRWRRNYLQARRLDVVAGAPRACDWRLGPTTRLTARLTTADGAPPGRELRVHLMPLDARGRPALAREDALQGVAGRDGVLALDGLAPGAYRVGVERREQPESPQVVEPRLVLGRTPVERLWRLHE